MVRDSYAHQWSPGMRLALQIVGFILLTALLIDIFSGPRGLIFLQAILGGICVLWLFTQPHWGVLIILSLWFVEFSPAFLGVRYLRIPYLITALLLFPLALSILRDREIWVWRVPQIKMLIGIGIIFLASTAWSEYKHPAMVIPELDQTGEMLQRFVTRLIFLIFFLYFITTSQRLKLTVWLLEVLILLSAMTALYHLSFPDARRAWAAFGPGSNPNSLAFICLFAASLLWFYYCQVQKRQWKLLALSCFIPLPVLAIASGSRSGFLQLLFFVFLIIKDQKDWSVTRRVRSMLLLGSVSLLFLSIVPATSLLRATSFETTQTVAGGESLSNRVNTVVAAFEMIASNPILGIGIGNFRWMYQISYGRDLHPHNSYIGALLSGGIGSLVLYLLLFFVTYRMLKKLEDAGPKEFLWISKGLRVNLVIFMIFSISDDVWLSDFLYLIVGLTVVLTRLWQNQPQELTPKLTYPNTLEAGMAR